MYSEKPVSADALKITCKAGRPKVATHLLALLHCFPIAIACIKLRRYLSIPAIAVLFCSCSNREKESIPNGHGYLFLFY